MPRKPLTVGEWCVSSPGAKGNGSCRAGAAGEEQAGAPLRLSRLFNPRALLRTVGVESQTERRANATPGEKRSKRYPVTVTPTEAAELEAKAAAAGMSVPRLLHESAKSSHVETSTERKAAIAELFSIRREVAGIATNLNQLARYANT
jgi:hypothetical protein